MIEDNSSYEWVSPSTMAERLGISTQMVYIRIKEGIYEARNYKRGSMNGWMVKMKITEDDKGNN